MENNDFELIYSRLTDEALYNLSFLSDSDFPVTPYSGDIAGLPFVSSVNVPSIPTTEESTGIPQSTTLDPSAPIWLQIADNEKKLGVKEVAGPANNPDVVKYLRVVGASDDEVPWCSAFVNWVMLQAGYAPTRSALARSWLKWGASVTPRYGAIVVFSRAGSTTKGHVGFYLKDAGDSIQVLGGNQSDSVRITTYNKSHVLSYRWPLDSDRRK